MCIRDSYNCVAVNIFLEILYDFLFVFGCSYVGCIHIYNIYVFLMDSSLENYEVTFRVSFFFFFYCYSITVVCLFSPSLHPTPGEPTSLPHLHPPPWFSPYVLYGSSCNPLFPLSPSPVSYTHLTLPTNVSMCRSRWSPYH